MGLIDSVYAVDKIKDEKPEFILILADATSNGSAVEKVLAPYKGHHFENFKLKIALSSVMGYAMYANRMLPVDEYLSLYS